MNLLWMGQQRVRNEEEVERKQNRWYGTLTAIHNRQPVPTRAPIACTCLYDSEAIPMLDCVSVPLALDAQPLLRRVPFDE
jgi:hypothetical protein